MLYNKIFNYLSNISLNDKILVKTHKNFCKLFYFRKEKFFRKISNSKIGTTRLVSDRDGLTWYCKLIKRNNKKIIKNFHKSGNNAYLDTFQINGYQIKSWNSLEKNYEYIVKILNHYKKYFPKKKISHIHGDLTFDNIFFIKKKIFIIDWEFFRSNKNLYGYDLAYLILSSLCIPYIAKRKRSNLDEKLFISLWRYLIKLKVNKSIIYDPFVYFEKNIKKDSFLKANFKLSKSKFFPFLVNSKYKNIIKKMIREKI